MSGVLPWSALISHGLRTLRMGPAEFWSMTPRELLATLGPSSRAAAPDRSDLDRLIADFPDGDA